MALRLRGVESKYVIWNISLPHPDIVCEIPVYTVDGRYELTLYVSCLLKKCGYRAIQTWQVSHSSYAVVPYIQQMKKSSSLTYERLSSNLPVELTRSTLEEYGIRGDEINMLFLLAPHELNISEKTPRGSLKLSGDDDVSSQSLSLESLSQDLIRLLDTKQHSDVLLKCGESSFPAHKNILATRSDVFAAMFQHDMKESSTGVVDIEDLDSSVLEQFVKYLYSGKVKEMTMDTALQLYQVAEKYAVHSLKQFCGSFMSGNLSKEVICKILVLADQVGDSKLLEAATCFAAAEKEFLKTEEWEIFARKYQSIGLDVYFKYVRK